MYPMQETKIKFANNLFHLYMYIYKFGNKYIQCITTADRQNPKI